MNQNQSQFNAAAIAQQFTNNCNQFYNLLSQNQNENLLAIKNQLNQELQTYQQEGILTGPQKIHPYSIILLDEMEKAPDDVLKALLGLMDEGTLKDSTGEEVSFKNSIIVFTTNMSTTTTKTHTQQNVGSGIHISVGCFVITTNQKRTSTLIVEI